MQSPHRNAQHHPIRLVLRASGFTADEFAAAVGRTNSYVSRANRGLAYLDPEYRRAASELLQVAEADLFHLADQESQGREVAQEAGGAVLSVDEAAQVLRVSSRFVRTLIARGELRVLRLGRRVLLRAETLDAFTREREAESSR